MARQELNLHIGVHVEEALLRRIRALVPGARITYQPYTPYETGHVPASSLAEAEVLLGYHVGFELTEAPRLRWLHLASDGVDHLRGAPIMSSDVQITNTRVFGVPIAEYVFGSVLAYFRDFPGMHQRFQVERTYPSNQWLEYCGDELAGKTMAILGYGEIGHALARRALAFDMQVVAVRRTAEHSEMQDGAMVHPPDALVSVAAQGDIVVVCLPLTDETEGLVDASVLRAMKPSAYLVAVGRGGVIDEVALARALRENWIAGAGLDVFAQRPLPPDSPFFDLPNVILTPHMSGITRNFPPRLEWLFCENLRRYLANEPLLNVVDKQKGY
ncbi:MAG: D-2-hydroxyacid dehydrogenase [Chloroflexi bacterium]|nr:D-2-hydroxyacid dehydrogenase [Chloroflexota bacterium]